MIDNGRVAYKYIAVLLFSLQLSLTAPSSCVAKPHSDQPGNIFWGCIYVIEINLFCNGMEHSFGAMMIDRIAGEPKQSIQAWNVT